MEQKLGTKAEFEEMLRAYIRKFSQKSITTEDWIQFLRDYYPGKQEILDKIEWSNWLNNPGVPPNKPEYNQELIAECCQLASIWSESKVEDLGKSDAETFNKMSSNQKIKVLDSIETVS